MSKKLRTPIAAILLIVITALDLFRVTSVFTNLFGIDYILNFHTGANIVLQLVLCGVLFAKKRDNILVIVIGCVSLLKFVSFVRYPGIFALLDLVAYALLLVCALALGEQTLIKADLSKIKELANKLFFLPATLYAVTSLFSAINSARHGYFSAIIVLTDVLSVIALLSITKWLKDPYAKSVKVSETNNASYVEGEYDEAYCGLGKHIVLCLFTFGIWYLIWTYRTTKFLNKAPNATYYNPTSKLLLCIFIPFYQIYWFYKHGQRIDAFSKEKQLNNSDMATLCLILGIFIPIVACIIMQDRINSICTAKAIVEEPLPADPTAEQLKRYKELLDNGVITQEDFDAKKKQLLGL